MSYKPKNFLITGGAGFIGSHFIDYLMNQYKDIKVINLDKLTYAADLKRLSTMINQANYHFVEGDICNEGKIASILEKEKIDTIVNFAAETHVDRSIANPKLFLKTNILGTQTLLECALHRWKKTFNLDSKQCRFHQISTDEVFGSLEPNEAAFTENSPYRPNSPYSASKAAADHIVRAYYKTYQLPVTLSQCSNNFGLYQHEEKLIPKTIRSCLKNQAIPIYNDGSNIRDWLDVDDHCRAIDAILNFGVVGKNYVIGGNGEYSNLEIVKAICARMDHYLPENAPHEKLMTFVNDRLGHDWRYAINNNFLKRTTRWYPKTSFLEKLDTLIIVAIQSYETA